MVYSFVDIHCHLLPGVDDGSQSWDESLAMARLAVADGTRTIIATPHQLGNFSQNRSDAIRELVLELQRRLAAAGIPLAVLPGADVRIESELEQQIAKSEVLTLGDHRRHVLLELPHDLYLPLESLIEKLSQRGLTCILSHPERNEGILRDRSVLIPLVEAGCLMQITAGSLHGAFGPEPRQMGERMLREGLVHFVASDAHGPQARRPLMRRAFDRIVELTDEKTAIDLCCAHPSLVASGRDVSCGRRCVPQKRRGWRLARCA